MTDKEQGAIRGFDADYAGKRAECDGGGFIEDNAHGFSYTGHFNAITKAITIINKVARHELTP